MEQGLSIIVPLRINDVGLAHKLADHYMWLISTYPQTTPFEILIPDSSPLEVYTILKKRFESSGIHHFSPCSTFQTGKNDKLNNIHAALAKARFDFVLLLDDDARPTEEIFSVVANALTQCDYLRMMVRFKNPGLYDRIDLSGIFVVNCLTAHKQYWANFAFRKSILLQGQKKAEGQAVFEKDVLFDELSLESTCRLVSNRFCYITTPSLCIQGSVNSTKTFLRQRLRYAYENLAYPFRFGFFLSLLPLLVAVGALTGLIGILVVISALSISVIKSCASGVSKYSSGSLSPFFNLYALIWFWMYPFFSWIALFYYCFGGIKFGPHRIKKII